MIFPTVHGTNLSDREFVIPYGLGGEFNILLLAFEPSHQYALDSWVAMLEYHSRQYSRLRYYIVAAMEQQAYEQRVFIEEAIRQSISDPKRREVLLVTYVDRDLLFDLIDIPNDHTVYIFLIDHEGHVHWRDKGYYNNAKSEALSRCLRELHTVDDTRFVE